MKKYALLFLLVPLVTFAGGSGHPKGGDGYLMFAPTLAGPHTIVEGKHENKTYYTPPPVAPSVVPIQPAPTPQPSPAPVVPVAGPTGGGNGQIYCSGPTAPGWQVDVPDGGCNVSKNSNSSSSPEIPDNSNHPTFVMLNAVPYTGATLTDFLYDFFFWWL